MQRRKFTRKFKLEAVLLSFMEQFGERHRGRAVFSWAKVVSVKI